jgi:hypothetical protein
MKSRSKRQRLHSSIGHIDSRVTVFHHAAPPTEPKSVHSTEFNRVSMRFLPPTRDKPAVH